MLKNIINQWIEKLGNFKFRITYALLFTLIANVFAIAIFKYVDGVEKTLRENAIYSFGYFFIGYMSSKDILKMFGIKFKNIDVEITF